ncbi:AAA family ATPase [Nonomuraea rubra]|uniref:AAA family ATPase n=1 Tax=Nonomuraea rubra TaxID=46180 RepID=UPI0033F9F8C0
MLYGRQAEQAAIDELLRTCSGALILRGEAGIGKSALLSYAAERARARVLRPPRLSTRRLRAGRRGRWRPRNRRSWRGRWSSRSRRSCGP